MRAEQSTSWGPIWLLCQDCGHAWDDWQSCRVPFETWIAHVKSYRCPECGADSKHISLRIEIPHLSEKEPP